VQQYADITYRLYDYGRPRELHLDEGVAVARAGPYADPRSGRAAGNSRLVDGPHFWLDHIVDEAGLKTIGERGPFWLTPISGETRFGTEPIRPGQCYLAESLDSVSISDGATLLVAGNATD
jgi:mannose-6-phosphate isomerase